MCTPYYQSRLNLVSEICIVNTFSSWDVTVIFKLKYIIESFNLCMQTLKYQMFLIWINVFSLSFLFSVLVLYSVISVSYFNYLMMASKHRGYVRCLAVNLYLELRNATTHSQLTRSSQIYVLKIFGDQTVSTPIQLEYAVFILVTPWNMFSSI